jgi:hypothetical protein
LAVSKILNGLRINNDKTNEKLDPEGEEKSLKMGIEGNIRASSQ